MLVCHSRFVPLFAFLSLMLLSLSACLNTKSPDRSLERPSPVAAEPQAKPLPEPSVATETVALPHAESESLESDNHELVEDEALDEHEPATAEDDPQNILEQAMTSCQLAETSWRNGELEAALAQLDHAYSLILKLEENDDALILQGRDDLRYLISKRVVEIHASQRTVVGDLSMSIPLDLNEHVEAEIKSFQTRERRFFLESYQRSGQWRQMMVEALQANHMPEQLAWLPLIESGFKTRALSKARALGPWQFIPSTGYRYGLARNHWYDERMDPVKSTRAAIAYLQDLHGLFGDWLTALAAYNCGEGRVLRLINRQRLNYLDHFWDLYTQLPRETARYVPRFIATLLIINDPAAYGFELPEVDKAVAFETVDIERAVSLDQLDQVLGLEKGAMKDLNPEIRRGVTPTEKYSLRVPALTADEVLAKIDQLPRAESAAEEFVLHRVSRGDSLSLIASKYGTTVSRIVAANNLNNQHRIWPGQQIKVPGRNVSLVDLANSSGGSSTTGKSWKTYEVRAGDSLWRIAKTHGVSVGDIKSWNGLRSSSLSRGQKLKLMTAASSGSGSKVYAVRQGDTLGSIAKQHGVELAALLAANKMTNRDTIYPNQKLVIP